jgi:hypothetical protein
LAKNLADAVEVSSAGRATTVQVSAGASTDVAALVPVPDGNEVSVAETITKLVTLMDLPKDGWGSCDWGPVGTKIYHIGGFLLAVLFSESKCG